MAKRAGVIIMTLFVFFFLLGAGILFVIWSFSTASSDYAPENGEAVVVAIPAGSSFSDVLAIAKQKGMINNVFFMKIISKMNGWDKKVIAGSYILEPGDDAEQFLNKVHRGDVIDSLKITIPEGYTVKQIAALLEDKGVTNKGTFLQAVKDFKSDKYDLPNTEYPLEGYLFPDTYEMTPGEDDEKIINTMLDRFGDIIDDKYLAKAKDLNMSLNEIVTIASLVEREAQVNNERPIIAGVFMKRLEIGMPLQSCATIQYLLPEQKEKLTYADLKIDSPYNTYKHRGLPPGPIACPGKASLMSVLNANSEGYLYFVSKNDGTHVFSKTLQEHNKAKNIYQ